MCRLDVILPVHKCIFIFFIFHLCQATVFKYYKITMNPYSSEAFLESLNLCSF